jgi:RNA polymerase sigma-70 factor (ECF subfamily)
MSGDSPAAFVPAASRPGLLARAEPVSRRQERRLVRDVQRGSAAALEELFRREWPRAYRAAYLVVHDAAAAEDIAQEAFLSALSALDRFDRRRPFAPWLHRIAVNRAIDWSRARAVRHEVAAADSTIDSPRSQPPLETAPEAGGEIEMALAELSAEHRAVVILRYLLDYTPGEISAILDLPRGTINSRLRRGLDRLSGLLGEDS